ncbi:MAG: hypothetical protein DMF61_14450 [Blastocatellia bacterium AA13]|nr:MAG: hypothetical protein DMF61_14450 [Blastocatellia bacterium AA13]
MFIWKPITRIVALAASMTATLLVGQRAVQSAAHQKEPIAPTSDLNGYLRSYRSNTHLHKVLIDNDNRALQEEIKSGGGTKIADYDSFSLFNASSPIVDGAASRNAVVRDDMNLILLRAGAIDTTEIQQTNISAEPGIDSNEAGLYLIQMRGPIKPIWFKWLEENVRIVSYIPNNTYLVSAGANGVAAIRQTQASQGGFIQYAGPYGIGSRVAPEIDLKSEDVIPCTIQLLTAEKTAHDLARIVALAVSQLGEPERCLNYTNVRVLIRQSDLPAIAAMNRLIWIERWREPALRDERQGQIIAGNYFANQLTGTGYTAWLASKGISSTPDFVVDLSDSGIDQGNLSPSVLHRDFLNAGGAGRIAYARFMGAEASSSSVNDITGHGTLNASILGGYNAGSGFPEVDDSGYRFGLGIHPFARIGITKVFNPDFTHPDFAAMVDAMYASGARVSNNSWGGETNAYTAESQLYDSLVRDAQAGVPGNQEICAVFAAGNGGPNGHMNSPATAKNVIAVGASENLRPAGTDGCMVTPGGASDVDSIARFSSGGPVLDGRIKPDLVAPGTHIQGAQSQDSAYSALGICGPKNYPSGQTLYTWSSGTSHSAPAVAGAAALARQYFQQATGNAPSAAMTKAFLLNSTTWLNGDLSGDPLPSNTQGWGLLNLGRAFDAAPRILVDQTHRFTSTGQVFTLHGRVSDSSKPVRVTLAWTDAPGPINASPVVNDLDLQVQIGGLTYSGNYFVFSLSSPGGPADKLNNVESVWLPEGTSGDFTIRVIAANITGDGVPGNAASLDQDFALVAYNANAMDASTDGPPSVALGYPAGGESIAAGSVTKLLWVSSDDRGINKQRVEFSGDGGATFATIALLDGRAQSFDWLVPAIPSARCRIRVTALDGASLPVSSENARDFEIIPGPPDPIPPGVSLVAPRGGELISGGAVTSIKWTESDNVGVVRRIIELSTDGGASFVEVASIDGPGSAGQMSYQWQVPPALGTQSVIIRVIVYDGSGNAAASSSGSLQVWAMPLIQSASYITLPDGRGELDINGTGFRRDEVEIFVDDVSLRKISYPAAYDNGNGTFSRVISLDKKVHKRVPPGAPVTIIVKLLRTGQLSPAFSFRRSP